MEIIVKLPRDTVDYLASIIPPEHRFSNSELAKEGKTNVVIINLEWKTLVTFVSNED